MMLSLAEWATLWEIPPEAIEQLCHSVMYAPPPEPGDKSEALVQSEVRLEAARQDIYLYRNNVGAGKLESGNFVRFGLGNDSAPLNAVLKSGDLVGIRKRLITPADVGCYIGQFVSRECKKSNWKFSGTEKEHAQVRWAVHINSQGGDAQIVTGVGSLTYPA